MKKLLVISATLFAGSLMLHFAHIPGHGATMLLSILFFIIHNTIYFIKNIRSKPDRVFAFLTINAFAYYLFTRFYFWANSGIVLIISMLLLLTWLGFHFFKKASFSALQIVVVSSFVVVSATSFVHADRIFYMFNAPYLKESTASENYELWDRYSWFLYLAGKYDEAESANKTALKGVQELLKKDQPLEIWRDSEKLLLMRHEKIRSRSWYEYSDLPYIY